jgi:type IV pilus assembly protein PilA
MLTMLRGRKGKKGFTLIELMIVVAIIGILAAIAIPNFLRFQAKSKQSEAKTNLGGIFTAETSYFSENNNYANLGTVSWAPVGKAKYRYTTGGGTDMGDTTVTFDAWVTATPAIAATTPARFTAGAQGNVDTDGNLDQWTINDVRDLKNYDDDVIN